MESYLCGKQRKLGVCCDGLTRKSLVYTEKRGWEKEEEEDEGEGEGEGEREREELN